MNPRRQPRREARPVWLTKSWNGYAMRLLQSSGELSRGGERPDALLVDGAHGKPRPRRDLLHRALLKVVLDQDPREIGRNPGEDFMEQEPALLGERQTGSEIRE